MKKTIDTENRGFNYDETIDELQPRCEFRASAGLRDRIMQAAVRRVPPKGMSRTSFAARPCGSRRLRSSLRRCSP